MLRRWESIAGNLVLTTATVKSKKADVSSVSPSSEGLEELWVLNSVYCVHSVRSVDFVHSVRSVDFVHSVHSLCDFDVLFKADIV